MFTQCSLNVFKNQTITDSDEAIRAFFKDACPKAPYAYQCLDAFSNVTNTCLMIDEIESKDLYVRIFKKLTNFTCENIESIFQMRLTENQQCFEKALPKIEVCLESTIEKNSQSDMKENSLKFNETICTDIYEAEKCVVDNLNSCETKTSVKLVQNLFDVILSELPCNKTTVIN